MYGITELQTATPATTTIYTVTGTDVNGCSNTSDVQITVNPLPTVRNPGTDYSICSGNMTTLTGTGATTYVWDNGVTDGTALR